MIHTIATYFLAISIHSPWARCTGKASMALVVRSKALNAMHRVPEQVFWVSISVAGQELGLKQGSSKP